MKMTSTLEPITLKLVGNVADQHRIDVFQLADTVTGLGQVTSNSLYLLQNLEVAGKKQRVKNLQILAKPPEAGSFEIIYFIEALRELSPFFIEPFVHHGTELLWRTIGSTFLFNSNRKIEAMQLAEMTLDYMEKRDARDAVNRSEERAKDERIIHHLIESNAQRCQSGCRDTVSSLGKTSQFLNLPFGKNNVELSEKDATTIRLSAEESIGPEGTFQCSMDGIIEHSRIIKVQVDNLAEDDRYLTAVIIPFLKGCKSRITQPVSVSLQGLSHL